jgi:hypothetical protein
MGTCRIVSNIMEECRKKVFRFKFSNDVLDLMKDFSKVHQYDTKEVFNEKWAEFLDKNRTTIDAEKARLIAIGYNGYVEDKMYKSIKYYYNKKGAKKGSAGAGAGAGAGGGGGGAGGGGEGAGAGGGGSRPGARGGGRGCRCGS